MILSRNWLNEFVPNISVNDIDDKAFSEAMTISGSKVETFEELGHEISNVVVGRVTEMKRHPNSDHMWVCQIDVGDETVQICTGAWNVHVGDLVPVAKHKSTLPGGIKITKGKLRGEASNGMLCGMYELGLDEHDFPYGVIEAAAILGDLLKMQEEPIVILAALGSQLRRLYTARMAIDSGKDKYWLMELWEMRSDYPAKLLLQSAKRVSAQWCGDAVKMCQVVDLRMKSQRGADPAEELKLLLARLGAARK